MKKVAFLSVMATVMYRDSHAQNTWTQQADFGGIARELAVGFSIGDKGYIGTGDKENDSENTKDFWEYDPATNAWTQKADFGGGVREEAVGFSIEGKGYIGLGISNCCTWYNDFWEYDPSTNAWTQKANFGGTPRALAVGFSIGSKGYIGTGWDNTFKQRNDFWEYDPSTDTWTQKANVGGWPRAEAVGFSIESKGYVGTGIDSTFQVRNDFWEYDTSTNAWKQKADFGGTSRYGACGFSIDDKGYVGTGQHINNVFNNDFWEYNTTTNSWTQKANMGGTGREFAVAFSIDSNGYVGTGWDLNPHNDFWKYTPGSSSCDVPVNLSTTNITSSSAKLKWDAVAGAQGYLVRYRVANTSNWMHVTTYDHSKVIVGLLPATEYKWQVKSFCQLAEWSPKQDFTTKPLRLSEESSPQLSFQLYPNPAEDHTTIQYTLAQSSSINISVFDVSGKEMETVSNDDADQGIHVLQLNIKDFPAGTYLVKMISDFGTETLKMMVNE